MKQGRFLITTDFQLCISIRHQESPETGIEHISSWSVLLMLILYWAKT